MQCMHGCSPSLLARALALAVIAPAMCASAASAAQPGAVELRRASAPAAAPANVAAARRSERARMGRFGLLQVSAASGGVRAFGRLDKLLTAASARPAADIALDYVRAHQDVFGLDADDLSAMRVVRHYTAAGIEQVRWAQTVGGVTAIDTSLTANLTPDGRLINIVGEARHDLSLRSTTPAVSASEALAGAARALGGRPARALRSAGGPSRETSFAGGARAKLVIYERGGPRPGWRVTLPVDSSHVYDAVVDATTGELERSSNLVESAAATIYRNYPGAPAGGSPQSVSIDAYLDPGATRLIGPDAHSFTDADDVVRAPGDSPPPAGEVGPSGGGDWLYPLTNVGGCTPPCIWDPFVASSWAVNADADATQVHWFVSNFHDHLESTPEIDFSDAAGNFEGPDPVLAQSMDGANTAGGFPDADHVDNANMTTYPDGTSPHMQMYLTESGPGPASTGFDAAVIYHEYTHGLVGRTIVDASGNQAVSGAQSGAFNEGAADFYAIDYLVAQGLEADAAGTPDVTFGKFAFDNLRSEPTDCPVPADPSVPDAVCGGGATPHYGGYTYADFGDVAGGPEVHSDGEIWTQTMWQLRQALIASHGAAEGVARARRLATNGMRLVPDNPSLLDQRNGILQAAVAGGFSADLATIWAVFAQRGMGYFASTTSSFDLAPIADTSLPPPAGGPTGTVSGTVVDAAGGGPAVGVKVGFTGHDSGVGPELAATTSASGAYAISGVPPATYPLLRARGDGYLGESANVGVAAATVTTRNFSLPRNLASAAAGAQIASFSGPDAGGLGCGPDELIDQEPGTVWGSSLPTPQQIVVELPLAIMPTSIDVDPSAGCGDDVNASLGDYELQASPDGTSFASIASGTFSGADVGRYNPVSLSSAPAGTRFVKLIAKSSQANVGSGAVFVDVAELRVFGTPASAPPPPPPPQPLAPPAAPAAAPPPAPLPAARDVTPPKATVAAAATQKLGRRLTVSVTCPDEPCRSRATATARVPAYRGKRAKTYRLGPVTTQLVAKGKRTTLALAVTKTPRSAIRGALLARKRVVATVALTVEDAAGNPTKRVVKIRLKR